MSLVLGASIRILPTPPAPPQELIPALLPVNCCAVPPAPPTAVILPVLENSCHASINMDPPLPPPPVRMVLFYIQLNRVAYYLPPLP